MTAREAAYHRLKRRYQTPFEQRTAMTLQPCCAYCGGQQVSVRRDGEIRCDGCHRIVSHIEVPLTTDVMTTRAAFLEGRWP